MCTLYLLENSKTETGSEEIQQEVRSHKESKKKIGLSYLLVLQNACLPQMFASNINNMPNKPLCSSLRLQLPLHNAEIGSESVNSSGISLRQH